MVARTDALGKALNATAETIHLQDTIIITIVASGLVAGIREGLSRRMDKGSCWHMHTRCDLHFCLSHTDCPRTAAASVSSIL